MTLSTGSIVFEARLSPQGELTCNNGGCVIPTPGTGFSIVFATAGERSALHAAGFALHDVEPETVSKPMTYRKTGG